MVSRTRTALETQKKRSLLQRVVIVHIFFLVCLLMIVARLIELQIVRGAEYRALSQSQHYSGITLPAKRGEILSLNSKTGEQNMLATNTTLDLVYVDPVIANPPDRPSDATLVAETLADVLLTEEFHADCSAGKDTCPRELMKFYASAFDPVTQHMLLNSGSLLEPLPIGSLPTQLLKLPDILEARRLFARDIERRVSEKRVTFTPLKYGATKIQMTAIGKLDIVCLTVDREQDLIYANPEKCDQNQLDNYARKVAPILEMEVDAVRKFFRARPLRYVPIMRRLPPALSLKIKEVQLQSLKATIAKRSKPTSRRVTLEELQYPLRSIAFIAEHWRFYPDTTIGSHIVGFVNSLQEPQYGVERTFNPQLRGQEGRISTVSDLKGTPIQATQQAIVNPKDGDTIVLTIDRSIQKELETLLQEAVTKYKADSGQAIVLEPDTGRVIAMVNAPLFDSNNYAHVYEKEIVVIQPDQARKLLVELYHPQTNALIVKDFDEKVFTASGRSLLPKETQTELTELEKLYDLRDLTRYYLALSKNIRREVFPTDKPAIWLKFKNDIGVGAYLNRNIQEIFEPGSIMKPITMAIALDQGEVAPNDIYNDTGPVKVDEYLIKNALLAYYGKVSMIDCLAFSINTCMTNISERLGPRLFPQELIRFGFGKITGVELEDELSGVIPSLGDFQRQRSLLATASFGQGVSATPLQMAVAWGALANGGKLMKPTIVDSVIDEDGTVEHTKPQVIDQVITPETSQTISAMLTSSTDYGFAKVGKVPGYRIAGKTGTSQIAKGGRYEEGSGTTIATFAGFAPADNPRFVIIIKIDRPKSTVFGVVAAAPVFQKVAQFLFNYYGIPPDQKKSGQPTLLPHTQDQDQTSSVSDAPKTPPASSSSASSQSFAPARRFNMTAPPGKPLTP